MRKKYNSLFHPSILNRLLLIIVSGLFASSAVFGQTASIGPTPATLTEANLNTSSLTLTLGGGETFIDYTSLLVGSFALVGAPPGTSIAGVTGTSATGATIDLDFNYTDFDSDHSISINISAVELTMTSSGVLSSSTVSVEALQEAATINDPGLNEAALDGQTVTVTLTEETFSNPGSMGAGNFTLNGEPGGLTVAGFVGTPTSTQAVLDLAFTPGDFDTDFTDFYVTVNQSVLTQSNTDLTTNAITITHANESATLAADPALSEYPLNGRIVSITLTDETFSNPGTLVPGNFTPVNEPHGLTISSISGTPTSTSVDLVLGFDLTDFDVDYNDFQILIDDIVLVQSTQDLATNSLPITYGLEPVITNISIPNDTMRIGSEVDVTITVEDDEGNNFTLVDGGVIGGYPLEDLSRIDATTYTCTFTVFEGGLDYAASQDIHVNDVQFLNVAIPGNLYTLQYISQDNDLLDANAPVIRYIYTNTDGPQNVGSEIFLWIQTEENGLNFTPISEVNYVPVSSPSIEITESGGGRYRLRYVVAEGDNNVDPGEISVTMVAIDDAGNTSGQGSIDPNNVSIDASIPVITNAYISSTDDDIIVGETIEIVVDADQAGYRNDDASTWINGVFVDPPDTDPPHLTFTDLLNGSYQYFYTVQEDDGAVARGDLAISIMLLDADPFSNSSLAFTDLNPNNVQIETSRPSASISGPSEICYGDSALLTVILGGTAPWTMDIFDGTSTVQHSSAVSPYTFWVYPEVSTDYTVTLVVDGTGLDNIGTGIVSITVHELPDVQITNLQGMYDIASPPVLLEYTPAGGTFTGPGISASPWTFDPNDAGVTGENSPHEIVYSYTDVTTGCTSSDIKEVIIVSGSGFITFEKEDACFNDSTFLITGFNVYGTTGSFSVQPTPPIGAFENLGNDSAILRPNVYVLNANQDLTIVYTFEDQTGSDILLPRPLIIEYLVDAQIDFIPDVQICQNEDPIALSGNYETSYTFTSPGDGVEIDSAGNYHFYPELADTGTNLVVYEYISPRLCHVSTSVELIVFDAPDAGFIVAEPCIPLDGGLVKFESRSDSASVRWLWDFGDPESGLNNNRSTDEDPTHHYDDTGSYTVILNVSNDDCDDQAVKTIGIHPSPIADFSWNSNCLTTAPILMTGKETVFPPDTVSNWSWKIDSAGIEIISSDTSGRQFSYAFPSVGTYSIRYKVITSTGCSDSIQQPISLSPTYLLSPDSPYSEDFELEGHGWVSGLLNQSQNSWTDTVVNTAEFPIDAASGTRAWYTDRPDQATPENSWVLSPCFNFNEFYRPMVSLDIKRSLHKNTDGAALQYTTDNEVTWNNVGDVDDGGLEWYNSTNIIPYVGNKRTGWTGESIPVEDSHWYEAAHGLDELVDEPEVRFRVAFGSFGDTRTPTNDGFAFDNFTISQRTRLSVLEYFTNANTALCGETDTTIMEIMNQVQSDVIDIQYHAMGSQADEFNIDNPVPANSRSTYYGVSGIPYAILDGNFMTYDFLSSGTYPNVEDIRKRSLMDPDFKLTITVTQYTPTLEFSIEIEALRNLVRKDRTLYAIVLERRVDDPEYEGTNGITVFRHAARRILPDAGGYIIGSNWDKGEIKDVELTYPTPFFPMDTSSITIAVFMQDDETLEILQASTNPEYVTSTFDELEPPSQVLIYPNPARELVNIYFEESPVEEMRFILYNLSGKMVITDVIQPWQQQFTRTLGDIEQGIYIVEIRSRDRRRVIYRGKLLHY